MADLLRQQGARLVCDHCKGPYEAGHMCMPAIQGRIVAERDRYIRLFNRLEAAISHHRKAHESGQFFADVPDEALWKAQDKILKDAGEGKG